MKRAFFFSLLSLLPSLYASADSARVLLPKTQTTDEDTSAKRDRSTYRSITGPKGSFRQTAQNTVDESQNLPNQSQGPIINFNNVNITEVLRYVSRLTGKNFVYDPAELQFNITMISSSSTTIEEVLAMVLQSLQAHGYLIMEEGGAYVIHTNPAVRATGGLDAPEKGINGPQIATQIFVLQNMEASRVAPIIKTMCSETALVEAVSDASVIISDITENVRRIADIIKELDSQPGGLEIGQYVAVNTSPATLVSLAERLITPLAGTKPLVLVPHAASNSIFIVSTPSLIERSLSVMQSVDLNTYRSGVLSKDDLSFDPEAAEQARKQKEQERYEEQERARKKQQSEVDLLGEEDIRSRLLERGVDSEFVNTMNLEAARQALKQVHSQHFVDGDLPSGVAESTQFLIHRLQYRRSTDVAHALRAIADSLSGGMTSGGAAGPINPELAHSDLIITLNSLQAVDDNNTIVFTGTSSSLKKIKQLISQIDLPVRQVFIEALIIDTTLANSLNFGVEWGGKLQRTNSASSINFRGPDSTFGTNFDAITFNDSGQPVPPKLTPPSAPVGLSIGNLGRKIKFLGKGFRSTGALINALQSDKETHVILNPQIVAEHNIPAEIFVGAQTPIKGQSIANTSAGGGITNNLVTTNYEIQETGVSLKVTPLISSHNTVTLIHEQKVSSTSSTEVNAQASSNAPPATVREARTQTRIHMPSDHFLVMSGLIQEGTDLTASRIPCLGSLPLVGTLFGTKQKALNKRNILVFIRPIIIDTEEDIDEITRNREKMFDEKSTLQQGLNKQIDTLKSMLNLR